MQVTLVHVQVKPEHVDAFLEATRANHEASVREPGNVRFDILRSVDDPTRFVFYEAYVDEAAAAAHKLTPHYDVWRRTVIDWMAEPRVGVRYDGLLPEVAASDSGRDASADPAAVPEASGHGAGADPAAPGPTRGAA